MAEPHQGIRPQTHEVAVTPSLQSCTNRLQSLPPIGAPPSDRVGQDAPGKHEPPLPRSDGLERIPCSVSLTTLAQTFLTPLGICWRVGKFRRLMDSSDGRVAGLWLEGVDYTRNG